MLALALAALVVGGLIVRGALSGSSPPRPVPPPVGLPSTPAYHPDPVLARAADTALPHYPGRVPPVGHLDAGTRFVGVYGDSPGQPIQVDVACAGTGRVRLGVYPDGAQPEATGQVLATATVMCGARPVALTVAIKAPLAGRYQLVFSGETTAGGATAGVLAWRLIPW
jgi:hypothetical protein